MNDAFLITDFPQQVFVAVVSTSSICFAGIIRHCIVLCYVLIV